MAETDLYQQVMEWTKRLPRQLRCPACNDHHWELRSMEETLGQPCTPGTVPPVIVIMCTCCGHLGFFDSKQMGLC